MLSDTLLKLRKEKKFTQQEISKRLGMARTTYAGYENGSREPDNETLNKIADFHGVSIDYLLGRTEEPKKVLSQQARDFIDMLELTDEEIMKQAKFMIDGMELDEEDVKLFIALVRSQRAMRKDGGLLESVKKDNP